MRWHVKVATLGLSMAMATCRVEPAAAPVMLDEASSPVATAPPPSAAPSATVLTPADGQPVKGQLAPEVIQNVVRASFPVLRKCYLAGQGRSPNLLGRFGVRFVIALDGTVSSAEEVLPQAPPAGTPKRPVADPEVVRCVLRGFRALQFPAPVGGEVTATYPPGLASAE